GASAETPASVLTYAMWFLLAACPSSLLLATTNLLCQQVTTVSLLWVLPLSIYLLSFILCFDDSRWYRRSFFHPLFAVILFLTCGGLIVNNIWSQAILLPALLFLGCMICHGELVRVKPGVKRLTSFYLTVSAGGRRDQLGEAETQPKKPRPPIPWPARTRGFRFVQVYVGCLAMLALAALYRSTQSSPEPYLSSRNFYGAVRVFRESHRRVLVHGRTGHGSQLDPPNDKVPTNNYRENSAIGILLRNHPKRSIPGESLRVGLVGLGAGTLATYGQPGDYFRYYEINPDVLKLSSGPQPVFTFLRDSAAHIDVELGDARLLLERELAKGERQKFDVLVLDAFVGGTIPVHLLTREAFDTYWKHLDPDGGVIAVNITSRHVDLSPVLQGATAYFHAASIVDVDASAYRSGATRWVLLARTAGALNIQGLEQTALSTQMRIPPRLWTDDYSDIFRLERYSNFASFHPFHR
ncbi:MAG: hypothetical protein WBV69_07735, partial [Candidatus Sulfotelmatobacter sp.]